MRRYFYHLKIGVIPLKHFILLVCSHVFLRGYLVAKDKSSSFAIVLKEFISAFSPVFLEYCYCCSFISGVIIHCWLYVLRHFSISSAFHPGFSELSPDYILLLAFAMSFHCLLAVLRILESVFYLTLLSHIWYMYYHNLLIASLSLDLALQL